MKIYLLLTLLSNFILINGILEHITEGLVAKQERHINIQKPSIDQAKRNLWYAIAGLCNDSFLKDWECKLCNKVSNTTFVRSFSNGLFEVRGFVAVDHEDASIVVVFRGADGLSNVYDGLNLLGTSLEELNDNSVKVHNGFYRSMDVLSGDFLGLIDGLLKMPQYKDYNIKLIGHSFGGAIASIAMLRIQNHFNFSWQKMSLFTYGQPRTGNTGYADYVNSKPLYLARVVSRADPVPRFPPRILLDYTHHGNELLIDNGDVHFCSNDDYEDWRCGSSGPKILNPYAHLEYFDVLIDRSLC